jgi:arsenite methyltransferase
MAYMSNLTELEIKQAVRRHYAELAQSKGNCCASDCCASVEESESPPQESVAIGAGCGSPVTLAKLTEGETVLDLGSGGGIDAFRASKIVGPNGRVIGVDATPEMIFKAREVAAKYGFENVEFRLGEIEHMPIQSNSVDVVISNCVLNLVPDKKLAFAEIYRVLKPNGRIGVSDMVSTAPETKRAIKPEDWAACIAGAVTTTEYESLLNGAGFQNVKHVEENSPLNETCCEQGLQVKSVGWLAIKPPT